VRGGRLVEAQRPGDRGEDLGRRVPIMALLEPGVVLGADPGQHGHLASLEAWDPAAAGLRDVRLGGREERAAGAQVLAEAACCHAASLRGRPDLELSLPGIATTENG